MVVTAEMMSSQDWADCPFPYFEEPAKMYKIYNDGGHYIATRCCHTQLKPTSRRKGREYIDVLFGELYQAALREDLRGEDLKAYRRARLEGLFAGSSELESYIVERIKREEHNLYVRKRRFRRKGYMNRWNYFVTFTYDDEKQSEESFRKRLRVCLSHLHTRRGWRYMGVFERAPETGRLHFHGIFYVPEGEMLGTITEKKDYSTARGRMQKRHENDFFVGRFGRNDFEELNEMELRRGQTINYVLKYIAKSGERVIYSRGICSEICCAFEDEDIITEMQHYGVKYVLWDGVIVWERDVMHYKRRQMSIVDLTRYPRLIA